MTLTVGTLLSKAGLDIDFASFSKYTSLIDQAGSVESILTKAGLEVDNGSFGEYTSELSGLDSRDEIFTDAGLDIDFASFSEYTSDLDRIDSEDKVLTSAGLDIDQSSFGEYTSELDRIDSSGGVLTSAGLDIDQSSFNEYTSDLDRIDSEDKVLTTAGLDIDQSSFGEYTTKVKEADNHKPVKTDAGLEIDHASFSQYAKELENVQTGMEKLSAASSLLTSGAFASIPVTIGKIASSGLEVATGFEDASTTLTTLYGNLDTAKEKFQWLSDFAASTPFEFPELMDATIMLKNYGLEAQDYMRILGDTSSAMGKQLNDTVEAITDAQQGEFERLKEYGVKAIVIQNDEIAKQLGVAAEQIGKTALTYTDKYGKEQVKVIDRNNRDSINAALIGVDGIFQKYTGAMETRSKTLTGLISTLKDNLSMSLADFVGFNTSGLDTMEVQSASILGIVKELTSAAVNLTSGLSDIPEPLQTFILVAGVGTGISLGLAGAFSAASLAGITTTGVMTALSLAVNTVIWPATAVVGALALLAGGLVLLDEKTGLVSAGFQTFEDVLTITFDAIGRLVDWLVSGISTAATEIYNYLSNMIPPGLSSAISSIGGTISSIFGGITSNIHQSAENIRADGQTVETSAQGVSTQMSNTGQQTQASGGLMSSIFNAVGGNAQTMGTQVTGATGQMTTGFGSTGSAAGVMGNQVTSATGQMTTGFGSTGSAAGVMATQTTNATGQMTQSFTQTSTGADIMAGKIIGVPPSINILTGAVNGGTAANKTYAASFIDVSNMASDAASAAINASSRIGRAITTSKEQVGNIAALAGKWNTTAKLGITSSGGSGTGEGNVKVIAAKTTNNVTVKV